MVREQIQQLVGNKFFKVKFRKKDGSIRDMACRIGVGKYVKGTGYHKPESILVVWEKAAMDKALKEGLSHEDAARKAYRSFNVDQILSVSQGEWVLNFSKE